MRFKRFLLALGATMACISDMAPRANAAASSGSLRIENQALVVELDLGETSFSVTSSDSGLVFVRRGTLGSRGAQARRLKLDHPTWGAGEAIQVEHGSGATDRLMLSPGLPFVVFESTLANGSDADITVGSIRPASMVLDLKKEADGLRAFGTAGLTGQLNASSTDHKALSPARLHLLQRSMPAHGLKPRPVDLFEQKIARIWLLTDDRRESRRDVVGLFNWDEKEPAHISCPAEKIGLPSADRYVGFDYWADEFVGPFGGSLASNLPPASCRILAIRPVSTHPQIIGTSRHITQGIIDLLEEKWDSGTQTLSGTSRVVANDPYELRIAAMGEGGPWRVTDVATSKEDADAGVGVSLARQDDWRIRVRIDSPASRDVRWRVRSAQSR